MFSKSSLQHQFGINKFRFKYWNGSQIFWTYHFADLTKVLVQGRESFTDLINKYQPITDLLFYIRDNNENIKFVRYKYYPISEIDIEYEVQFFTEAEDKNIADIVMKDIFNQVNDLQLDDLKMDINYSFEKECIPCQKAKEKQNERENMER